jgi:hypothetical protein
LDKKKEHICRYCGRAFTTATSMYRHVRGSCKIANSDEGMDKLMEHTLQRQLAEVKAQSVEQNAKIDRLTLLLEQQLTLVPAPASQRNHVPNNSPSVNNSPAIKAGDQAMINTGTINNNTVINITPWDGERCISVGVKQVAAAFLENARLKEYSRLEEHQLTDPDIAPPYVTELLTDLARRAHADPAARNVYLNPKRADQVLVYLKTEKWEVRPLEEATRMLFDGVAASIHRITLSDAERRQLPLEAQNALSMAGLVYEDERDEYVKRAKAPMAAHLANTRPQ